MRRSPTLIASISASVANGRPYGCPSGYATMSNSVSASTEGCDFANPSEVFAWALSLSSPASGKIGFMTSSAMSVSASLRSPVNTRAPMLVVCTPAPARIPLPTNSIASSIFALVRLLVPSPSIAAVNPATCSLSIVPARTPSWIATIGTSWFSTT